MANFGFLKLFYMIRTMLVTLGRSQKSENNCLPIIKNLYVMMEENTYELASEHGSW